jgi:hypothetical protein
VRRALATGDLDDDGDVDVLTIENDGPVSLLEGQPPAGNRWIGFALTGTTSPRTPIGATVTIECGGRSQIQLVTGSASYFAWNDLRLLFGLGPVESTATVRATIRWPSGQVQELPSLPIERYHAIEEPRSAPLRAAGR